MKITNSVLCLIGDKTKEVKEIKVSEAVDIYLKYVNILNIISKYIN